MCIATKGRQRPTGVSIENFLGELKDKPEVLKKKLTEAEKEETNKKIEEKELKEALERVSSGKTPGIDGIEREFLLRFWRLLGTTITQATEIYIEREKLNSFMDRGLIKVIQKACFLYHPIPFIYADRYILHNIRICGNVKDSLVSPILFNICHLSSGAGYIIS